MKSLNSKLTIPSKKKDNYLAMSRPQKSDLWDYSELKIGGIKQTPEVKEMKKEFHDLVEQFSDADNDIASAKLLFKAMDVIGNNAPFASSQIDAGDKALDGLKIIKNKIFKDRYRDTYWSYKLKCSHAKEPIPCQEALKNVEQVYERITNEKLN